MNNEQPDWSLREKLNSLNETPLPLSWDRDELWDVITSRQRRKSLIRRIQISAIAAVVILAVGGYWSSLNDDEQITIRYREEVVDVVSPVIPARDSLARFTSLLEERCRNKSTICTSPAFLELKGQWHDLEQQSNEIHRQLLRFGNDEDLLEARNKIMEVRTHVEKELLDLVGEDSDE
ncbi:MAG TPA: hypothetical protein PLX35_17325 [Cyclobacteriaceae bacterium]|nr:hypothetical protein [Cyclobacteriaceae bacterium]